MRIAFDGTTLRSPQTGVGYYTEHLLQHLLQEADAHDEFLIVSNRAVETSSREVLNAMSGSSSDLPPSSRAAYIVDTLRFPIRNVWLQTLLPLTLRRLAPDIAHFTNSIAPLLNRRAAPHTVVTIHDMTLNLFPRLHPLRKQILTRPLVAFAARRADAIIAVSHSAKNDIVRLLGVPAERVHVIHEAAAPAFHPIDDAALLDDVRRRHGLADRIILYVGTIEPRKNLPRLLEAYASLRHSRELPHQLVCVGPPGWGYQEVQRCVARLGLQQAVRFTGYVPFEDLAPLYNLSEIFIFPSLYEGFGLPVIEAMACATPVITARNSSFGEIADGAVETIDPLQTESIADALVRLSRDAERRRELGQRGHQRAQEFSWTRAARETLALYRDVAGS